MFQGLGSQFALLWNGDRRAYASSWRENFGVLMRHSGGWDRLMGMKMAMILAVMVMVMMLTVMMVSLLGALFGGVEYLTYRT